MLQPYFSCVILKCRIVHVVALWVTVFQITVSSSDGPMCRMRGHSSVSRRNLAVIVEAIQHLEGDQFYCGTEESFEESQSGDSDGDDPSMMRAGSAMMCNNTVSEYTCLPDTPEDLSVFHHSHLFLPVSTNKNR